MNEPWARAQPQVHSDIGYARSPFYAGLSPYQSARLNLTWINTEFACDDNLCRRRTVWREQEQMSLAKAIEYHVDAFVEHSISPSLPTLAALKNSRRNLAEAVVRAILR
jgi:hypothetical protein